MMLVRRFGGACTPYVRIAFRMRCPDELYMLVLPNMSQDLLTTAEGNLLATYVACFTSESVLANLEEEKRHKSSYPQHRAETQTPPISHHSMAVSAKYRLGQLFHLHPSWRSQPDDVPMYKNRHTVPFPCPQRRHTNFPLAIAAPRWMPLNMNQSWPENTKIK